MTRARAEAMARVLGGVVVSAPTTRDWATGITRPDGRYVLIESDAAARYFDRHACDVGYHVLGSDPKGEIEAAEWGWPPDHRRFCEGLADLLGGQAPSAGGRWVAMYERPDGRTAVVNEHGGQVEGDDEVHEFPIEE